MARKTHPKQRGELSKYACRRRMGKKRSKTGVLSEAQREIFRKRAKRRREAAYRARNREQQITGAPGSTESFTGRDNDASNATG